MNYIPVRKENYADSKEQGISCDDVEDVDDQQFIVHTAQPIHPEERTAAGDNHDRRSTSGGSASCCAQVLYTLDAKSTT
ncbi:hypothetical protein Tco_0274160 [Tanacetum coccineum]